MAFFLAMLFHAGVYAQQDLTISGKVVAASNNSALPGVTITVKGTPNGTTTNEEGSFTITIPRGATLVFSSVGFQETEVVANSSTLTVRLIASDKGLEEVVVVGYGTQTRRNITGAISSIDVTKLKDFSSTNATKLLQGTAPGVAVKQTTGSPGREFQVTVRGLGSLGASSNPLYVVDGFPVGTSIGQNLNPDDIANITILKDAVSTAIYGARGSNGVVLITTKRAQEGKASLNVTANYGVQNVPDSRKTKVLNGQEFAQFKKDAFMDKIRYFENREPDIDEVPMDFRYPEQTKYSTNWLDEILNDNAPYQDYNITFSQGNGDIKSLVSVGYIDQKGALIGSDYKNYSVRANVDGKVNSFINMGLNLAASYAELNWDFGTEGRANAVGSTLLADPREPVYNEDGTFNQYIGGHDGVFGFPNPVQNLKEVLRRKNIGDILANGFVELSFLKHFKFKSAVNARLNYYSFKQYVPSTIAGVNAPPPRDASSSNDANRTINLSADQLLTYANHFGEHRLDVLLGYSAQEETFKGLSGSGSQFPDDLTPFLSAATLKSSTSSENGWSLLAYFTRINYSYKGRYLFSGTFRREGSSRFGLNNRYGNFPALSVGWRISDESFMSDISWLNDLKLRASWGETGNNNIGNYSSLSFLNPSNYILGDQFASGVIISSFANSKLGWEKSSQLDIGLDLSTLDGKLTFTADYYRKLTSDMLLSIQLPAISGFTSSLGNVGKVQNTGLEFALGYRTNIRAVNLWGNFNISFNRNKVLAIRGENDELWTGDLYSNYNVSKVGRPIGMIYGFRTLGIFQNEEEIDKAPVQEGAIPGSFIYWDASSDGVIQYDQTDMVEIGNPWPKFTYGLTLGGNYKNLDLTVLLMGAQGYDIFRQVESSTMNMDGVFNVLKESKDRWRSEENPGKGYWPTTNFWKWERESNSRYVHDASHIWIKDITLGYTLPKKKWLPRGFRVYVSANNLFLFTNYPGNNPDIDLRGGINPGNDDEAYPVPRTFAVGANLTF
ncbi:TonB-dependent receptor [Agriterribacter sp.]|uniref:SusC/RagA family TonB-linked outer membrane protein n=1 Tax=Agriterribacter sp. TaxID=2821509 RepID=UPI002BFDF301|nr:TonB-dependent receptor [Agriterribacter sp.]HRP54934.1 TonB-dependent receptor [Agriterribacter sp.]